MMAANSDTPRIWWIRSIAATCSMRSAGMRLRSLVVAIQASSGLFIEKYYNFYDWTEIKDVRNTTAKSINEYLDENLPTMEMIIKELVFESEKTKKLFPTS